MGIASLIVAIAQLAVGLYMTRPKGDGGKARIEIANELGARLRVDAALPAETIERIVSSTVRHMFDESGIEETK